MESICSFKTHFLVFISLLMLNKWCSVSKKTLNSVATVRAKEGNKAA